MRKHKKILLAGLLVVVMSFFAEVRTQAAVPVNEEHFPDASVRAYAESVDTNKDGVLSDAELKSVTHLSCGLADLNSRNSFVSKPGDTVDFTGMENFTSLEELTLSCVGSTHDRWNYLDNNLFLYFPYVKKLHFDYNERYGNYSKNGREEISLTGISDHLERLEIRGQDLSRTSVIKKWDVKAKKLKSVKIEFTDLSGGEFSMEDFPALERLEIRGVSLSESGINLKGLSSLEYLDLSGVSGVIGAPFSKLDLKPVKKTLKTLLLGPCVEYDDVDDYDEGSKELRVLDISQMEKLERVWAGHTGITKLITKDENGKSQTKKLKELCISSCKIKSIDVTAMPNLETLCVYNTLLSKLDVTKNKKLNLLQVASPNLKSINVKKNTKLDTLVLRGNFNNLDLSKNTTLRALRLDSYSKKARMTKLTLPMLKTSMKWGKKRFSSGYYSVYGSIHKVSTLDLSKVTKLTTKIKKYEMMIISKYMGLKKVIVNKKLKKADRNWIQKKAKAAGAKVVVK